MNTGLLHSILLATAVVATPLFAQDSYTSDVVVERGNTLVLVDHVGGDLRTPVSEKAADRSLRIVEAGADGLYHVRIRSAQRIQRMEGTYLDSALAIPHGRFIYYHPNGRIESVGEYDRGVKVGTWYTQDITGQGRAERTYTGLTVDELLVAEGVHAQARTVGR
ncbi:MAG: hypothetical protein JNM62_02190 [Flavobacteriales bacterium]|nr:hypothetical protein [Flavobacteriales bacterium]